MPDEVWPASAWLRPKLALAEVKIPPSLFPKSGKDEGGAPVCAALVFLSGRYFWERMRDNSCALFDRDDLIHEYVPQLVHLTAWPGDFKRIDLGALSQAEQNARVAGGHVTHAAFGLFDAHKIFGG